MILALILLLGLSSCTEILSHQSLAVTIYNDDFAMVKDVRRIKFTKKESDLYFTDVSANIETETVTFKPKTKADKISVYEQNFERNLVRSSAILQKFINQNIDVVAEFASESQRISGILLSSDGEYILQTDHGVVILKDIASIELPNLPDGFFTVPTLHWKIDSDTNKAINCQVAYRTRGFSWKSDYSLTLNQEETSGDIGGWITIDNNSGKKYTDAKVKLIAGQVNLVQDNGYNPGYQPPAPGGDEEEGGVEGKSFADYHLYTLPRLVTLNQASQKQVEFIETVYEVGLRKFNQILVNTGGYSRNGIDVSSKIQFENSDSNGLGIALPKGIFRVFKEDPADDSLQFVGEDAIDHTPKDEQIQLRIGNSFDVVADLIAESRINTRTGFDASMALTIVNHKETAVEVEVVINSYYGDNLLIEWNESNDADLQQQTAFKFKVVKVIQPDQTVVYEWSEHYENPN